VRGPLRAAAGRAGLAADAEPGRALLAELRNLLRAVRNPAGQRQLWHGYGHHRAYHAFLLLVPGLALLWAGILVPALHHPVVAHAVTMSLGGTLVALAHLVNMRLSRGHVHEHGHVRATD
jgi:hypothetical protein